MSGRILVGDHHVLLLLLSQKPREICLLPFVEGQDLIFYAGLGFGRHTRGLSGRELRSFGVDTPTTAHGVRDRPLVAVETA